MYLESNTSSKKKMYNTFFKEYKENFKKISRYYLWNNARIDRKGFFFLVLVIGLIDAGVMGKYIVGTINGEINSTQLYIACIISVIILIMYCIFVKYVDAKTGYKKVEKERELAYKKSLCRLLRKYSIYDKSQLSDLIVEVGKDKKFHCSLGEMKNVLYSLLLVFVVPIMLIYLEHLTKGEPLNKQLDFFIVIIAMVIFVVVVTYMVVDVIRNILCWQYDRLEYYLNEVLIFNGSNISNINNINTNMLIY